MNNNNKTQGISVKELRKTPQQSDNNNRWTQLHALHEIRQEKKLRLFDYLYGVDSDERQKPVLCKKSLDMLRNKSANHIERTKKWLDDKTKKLNGLKSKEVESKSKDRKVGQLNPDKTTLYLKPRMILKDKTAYVLKKNYRDAFDEHDGKGIQIDNLDFLN